MIDGGEGKEGEREGGREERKRGESKLSKKTNESLERNRTAAAAAAETETRRGGGREGARLLTITSNLEGGTRGGIVTLVIDARYPSQALTLYVQDETCDTGREKRGEQRRGRP